MKPATRALLAAVVTGAATFAALPAGASVARKPNACKVVKASEVTTVTGFPAAKEATQQQGPPDAGICGYTLTDPGTVRNVSIFVQPGSATTAKIGFKTAKKAFKDQLEPVTGFGKHAFYAAGGLNALYVRKGRYPPLRAVRRDGRRRSGDDQGEGRGDDHDRPAPHLIAPTRVGGGGSVTTRVGGTSAATLDSWLHASSSPNVSPSVASTRCATPASRSTSSCRCRRRSCSTWCAVLRRS